MGCGIGVHVPIFWFVAYLLVCEFLFLVCIFLVHILNLVSILTQFKVFFLNNFF